MPYNHVFLITDGDKPLGLYTSYDTAVSNIYKRVAEGDDRDAYPFVQVWKTLKHYEDGRPPMKGWLWREFLMVGHLYVPNSFNTR